MAKKLAKSISKKAVTKSPTAVGVSTANPGLVMVTSYVVLFFTSSVVVYLANSLLPTQIVLGTMSMNKLWAVLHSMGALALIATFALPFAHMVEKQLNRMLTAKEWTVAYFFLNFAGLWLITRFSDQFGLGVTHWYLVAILALVLDLVQGAAMMVLQKARTS